MATHNSFGIKGEKLAEEYLREKGFTILHRNYRYLKAEIDILARKEDLLAVVEVKSRSSEFFEMVAETVSQKKIKLMVMAANNFVIDNSLDVEVRFDIVTVLKKGDSYSLEHIENAFYYF
jgi:putative endonuclease